MMRDVSRHCSHRMARCNPPALPPAGQHFAPLVEHGPIGYNLTVPPGSKTIGSAAVSAFTRRAQASTSWVISSQVL